MIHRPTWLETAPLIRRLLPETFDWNAWCEFMVDRLPVDVYQVWHISTQPYLFDAAVEALYWPPAMKLCDLPSGALEATECLGLREYQRNYMVLWLCHRVAKYMIAGPRLQPLPPGTHMHSAPILPRETEERLVQYVLFGYTKPADSLLEAVCCYVQEPVAMNWSCVIPIGYITGVKADERNDGMAYEYCLATAQDNAKEEMVRCIRTGVFTSHANPFLRLSEVQVAKKTCIKLHIRFPACVAPS